MSSPGVVAAGHPLTAEAGAAVLRAGGNAVDAAVAALGAACACEPLLTGLGAGGHLLVAGFEAEPVLLDFFVAAPGLGPAGARRVAAAREGALRPVAVEVDFGGARQVFEVGAATVGAWGVPAGMAEAAARWGSVGLADLVAPGARLAREGAPVNAQQAFVWELLAGILTSTPEAAALFAPSGRVPRVGDTWAWPALGDALQRLGDEGAAPFYTGDVAERTLEALGARGGVLGPEDLAAYAAVDRAPVRASFRGRAVLTNPPPSAGGVLIAAALASLEQTDGELAVTRLVDVMLDAQAARTDAFVAGLDEPGFAERFLARRLGSTTHISVVDAEGRAAALTTTNGEGCGVVVAGTGMHPNNVMGEEDLNPAGFHAFAPGRRMPSMMAPTVVLGADGVELVLGSAGSNRIRSAILQTVVAVLDRGLGVDAAVRAPRAHPEGGVVYAEPGIDAAALRAGGHEVVAFAEPNLFFGGVQAVRRDPGSGVVEGAGDPRRGGVAVVAG